MTRFTVEAKDGRLQLKGSGVTHDFLIDVYFHDTKFDVSLVLLPVSDRC